MFLRLADELAGFDVQFSKGGDLHVSQRDTGREQGQSKIRLLDANMYLAVSLPR